VGTGVAASTYPARSSPSTAAITAHAEGRFTVRITASDVGTGARTAIGQVAADHLRAPLESVDVLIGDSDFGVAQISGGSAGMASWGWAVIKAATELLATLSAGASLPCTVRVDTTEDVAAQADVVRHAFGAQFAEVRVDVDTGELRVTRLFGAFAAGRVVNPKLARSQLIGGMTWGLSMALHEESIMDPVFGDYANHDLAGYHIATHADVQAIEAECIDEIDDELGPGGIKGLGEIGIVGTAAAIANAVWHATGTRHRDLPLNPARILRG
jgi:xanthine dehydrogenase YagR molybdenum-binding subunit